MLLTVDGSQTVMLTAQSVRMAFMRWKSIKIVVLVTMAELSAMAVMMGMLTVRIVLVDGLKTLDNEEL